MTPSQLLTNKGARIASFISDIESGINKWHRILLGELPEPASKKLSAILGLNLSSPLQVLIKDTVAHARNRGHALTLDDWRKYPELLEFFDGAEYGRASMNPDLTRIILRRNLEPNRWQGGVVDLALKGKEPKMLSVTYFIGNDKEIERWWSENKKP